MIVRRCRPVVGHNSAVTDDIDVVLAALQGCPLRTSAINAQAPSTPDLYAWWAEPTVLRSGRFAPTPGTTPEQAGGQCDYNPAKRDPLVGVVLHAHGYGTTCPCCRCGVLDDSTITVDRFMPGCNGRRYARDTSGQRAAHANSETGGALATRRRRSGRSTYRDRPEPEVQLG